MIYGTGAILGFTPQQVDAMTLWELRVCADAYARHNGGGEQIEPPSPEDHLDRVMRLRRGAV